MTASLPAGMTGLQVLDPGPSCTVQDLGRPGLAGIGVPRSGAADRGALRLANRLVGNDETAAGLEATYGGLRARALVDLVVAVTGAWVPLTVSRSGQQRPAAPFAVLALSAGDELALGRPHAGLRSYLAVRGGLDVPEVLGSRCTDILSGIGPLGPGPVPAGVVLPVGPPSGPPPVVDHAPVSHPSAAEPSADVVLRVRLGPRQDWLTPAGLDTLLGAAWQVTAEANRVGVRLSGPALERSRTDELLSEGLVAGAVQVPASGQPVLFLADHPVTGGYPVVAVLRDADLDAAGQLAPGQRVRLRATD